MFSVMVVETHSQLIFSDHTLMLQLFSKLTSARIGEILPVTHTNAYHLPIFIDPIFIYSSVISNVLMWIGSVRTSIFSDACIVKLANFLVSSCELLQN